MVSSPAESAVRHLGLIHYYFRRKLDLLAALIERHDEAAPDPARLAVPGNPGLALRRLITELDGRAERSRVLRHLLWREADTHGAVREAIADRIDRLIGLVRAVIVSSLPAGSPPADVESAATLVAYAVSYRQAVARHVECSAPQLDKRRAGSGGPWPRSLDGAIELVAEALLAGLGGQRLGAAPAASS